MCLNRDTLNFSGGSPQTPYYLPPQNSFLDGALPSLQYCNHCVMIYSIVQLQLGLESPQTVCILPASAAASSHGHSYTPHLRQHKQTMYWILVHTHGGVLESFPDDGSCMLMNVGKQ